MSDLDFKASKEGIAAALNLSKELPKQAEIEATGSLATDYRGKIKSWFAGLKLKF